jgi:aromatic-amino-acid transaminase
MPATPSLSLNEAFQKDPRGDKVNLSIGIYFDDAGRIPVLDCVRQAEAAMLAESTPKPYLPMEGSASMRTAVQALLLGAGHEALASRRVATLQTVGSSGGLKVGADFIKRWLPDSQVWSAIRPGTTTAPCSKGWRGRQHLPLLRRGHGWPGL